LLNYVLLELGVLEKPIPWLSHPKYALWVVMAVTVWKGLGYYALIFFSFLQSQSKEYQEAAQVEGASALQVLRHITVPLMKPAFLLCSTLSLVSALKVFEEVYVLTKGGPLFSTYTLMLFIFEEVVGRELGYAAAAGIFLGVLVGIFALANFVLFRRGGYQPYE
ncbi:MAG: sugar ABC transporter permease, partial [Parcubacteria group bacterium]|nr:sugar ABC transporter permease [Parcubacteria group bacterium]